MAKIWLVDGRTLAKRIKTSGFFSVPEDEDIGANWECPQCSCRINKLDEWPALPSGVKFDPTDVELLDHLAAKSRVGNERPHEYIDVFIPTIDVEQGICYKHPENLPGDLSYEFFGKSISGDGIISGFKKAIAADLYRRPFSGDMSPLITNSGDKTEQ